jgi:hypothetical protein
LIYCLISVSGGASLRAIGMKPHLTFEVIKEFMLKIVCLLPLLVYLKQDLCQTPSDIWLLVIYAIMDSKKIVWTIQFHHSIPAEKG